VGALEWQEEQRFRLSDEITPVLECDRQRDLPPLFELTDLEETDRRYDEANMTAARSLEEASRGSSEAARAGADVA